MRRNVPNIKKLQQQQIKKLACFMQRKPIYNVPILMRSDELTRFRAVDDKLNRN